MRCCWRYCETNCELLLKTHRITLGEKENIGLAVAKVQMKAETTSCALILTWWKTKCQITLLRIFFSLKTWLSMIITVKVFGTFMQTHKRVVINIYKMKLFIKESLRGITVTKTDCCKIYSTITLPEHTTSIHYDTVNVHYN